MPRIRSHYDNLQVSDSASSEVIEASYRALKDTYEPQRAQSSEARRILGLIDRAYEVLIDPKERRAHDEWIANRVRNAASSHPRDVGKPTVVAKVQRLGDIARSWLPSAPKTDGTARQVARLFGIAVVGLVALMYWLVHTSAWQTWGVPRQAPSIELAPLVDRHQLESAFRPSATQSTAPNGELWPSSSGYLARYPQLRKSGGSRVMINNSDGGADFFIKLAVVGGSSRHAARYVFVRNGDQFAITSVQAGIYSLYVKNLSTGQVQRTPTFSLGEKRTATHAFVFHVWATTRNVWPSKEIAGD